MADPTETRVAVYIDFDNIVISQYDAVHGRGAFIKEKARGAAGKTGDRLQEATVNIGAVLDFASSFGAVAISRAYADWAAPANTRYQKQLVDRAVDLVQLFNTSGTKNGADIRLAIDVVEDLFRLRDITHIVIVAGDSDYIPLAQSARRLGRTVIGIGVQGSTSAAFKNACDEFSYYGDLVDDEPAPPATTEPVAPDPKRDAVELMVRALRVRRGDDNVDGWVAASGLKQQMKRLDAGFDEKKIGYKSFTDFVKAQAAVAELQEDGQARRVRLKDRG
ncbi:MAG: NYN domain-containing protein [Actinobacteria bacterium]|nr:NYN domain-containing protein [Actinomycetota bacterium]